MDQCHCKGIRKSLDKGGSGPIVVAFYGKAYAPAVDFNRLMFMMMMMMIVNIIIITILIVWQSYNYIAFLFNMITWILMSYFWSKITAVSSFYGSRTSVLESSCVRLSILNTFLSQNYKDYYCLFGITCLCIKKNMLTRCIQLWKQSRNRESWLVN